MGTVIDLKKLQRALDMDGNRHTIATVADQIERGVARLWVNGESVVVTQVIDYPNLRALNFWLAAGTLPEVRAMLPEIYEYGRREGCTQAESTCRKGWARVMEDDGWKRADKVVVMTRAL